MCMGAPAHLIPIFSFKTLLLQAPFKGLYSTYMVAMTRNYLHDHIYALYLYQYCLSILTIVTAILSIYSDFVIGIPTYTDIYF